MFTVVPTAVVRNLEAMMPDSLSKMNTQLIRI